EGDVGSGKTLVAIIALYNVFLNKYQSAFMAPTEILARQHFETGLKFLENYGVKIGLITRSRKIINRQAVGKKEFLEKCRAGEIDLIIGTHAIIQKEIKFKKLALIVIDEQHRFGVEQRQLLKQKGGSPHLLSLTATPIPRSLALTLYGDLDLSIIRQMPVGRKKILTRIAPPEKRQLAYEFIAKQINLGRQVFVVCPLIDPSDKLGVRSVKQEFKKLDEEIFPDLPVGLLHGRLKAGQKEEVLRKFADNEIKILISTSVIEVGIDIPNASVMMIEGAERFGLAQLHQFRGRVGRSEHQSYCFLFSDSGDRQTLARLEALVNCHDGFVLANKDLELRGAGNIYGREQAGFLNLNLKIADLGDLNLVKNVRDVAERFVGENNLDDYPLLKERIDALGLSEHLE
ncbi:MAG: helicase-related protein, partial [Patescibacteria group bacterium]